MFTRDPCLPHARLRADEVPSLSHPLLDRYVAFVVSRARPNTVRATVSDLRARSTIEVVYGRVVAVFRAAVRDRVITTSPCVGIRLPSKPPASMLEVLSTEQVHALADAIAPRYASLVLTAAGTGLRPGELFGLRAGRVDFLRRIVRVDQQVARLSGGGVGLAPLKTQASYRSIPLPQTVADAIAAHMARWPPEGNTNVIFTNAHGLLIQEHPFSAAWNTAKRIAGTPDWATPHDLRHYYASVLIRSGASVKVLQARLGHASAKTTLDVYAHLFPDEEDRTRDALDLELRGPSPRARSHKSG